MKLTLDEQLTLAPTVATRAHHGQFRKDGTPYIAHPVRVAMRAALKVDLATEFGKVVVIAAYLHDVVEDTSVTLEELREYGFSPVVVEAVDSVTKRPGSETYMDFVTRSKKNVYGRVVKVADIEDNTEDQSALDPDEATFLSKRYEKALAFLKE